MAPRDPTYRDPSYEDRLEDIDDADRVLFDLYERSRTEIPRDASDREILAFARSIHAAPSAGRASISRFFAWTRSAAARSLHSPVTGIMVTASLVVGILVGQGLTPYVQFGVSPDYGDILDESERLSAQIKELGDFGGTQGYRDLLEENQRLIGRLEGEDTGAFRAPLESAGIGEQIGSGGGLAALTDLLTDSSCGGLSVSISGGALVVRGFVSNAGEKVALGAAISSLGPSDITDQTALLGAPYCLALGALEPAALHAPSGPVVQLAANAATGLPEVQVRASRAFDGPIYIDLVRADGTVVHMVPDPTSQVSVARPGQAFSFPVRDEFAAVSGDLVIVVSSPVPLGLDDRPAEEAAAAYYADLRRALSEQSLDPTEENAQAAFAFVP